MAYEMVRREGEGRWTAVSRPAPGVLWTDDDNALGFVAAPGTDGGPVLALIDTHARAGEPASTAFDQLAAVVGSVISEGDIDRWLPTEQVRRPMQ